MEEGLKRTVVISPDITITDIKRFLGVCIFSSVVQVPNLRLLWNPVIGNEVVIDALSINDFERIRRFLHFNDNEKMIPYKEDGHDRLYKVRPVMNRLLCNFQKVPLEESLSVDEQLCATKTASFLKQYLPDKPHKWGYKFFVLCGVSGFAYNFELYTGNEDICLLGEPDLGASSNVVVRLARIVPDFHHHKLYFDNYYTSMPLLSFLEGKFIHSLGTVKFCRLLEKEDLKNAIFDVLSNRKPKLGEMKHNKRGDYIEYVTELEGHPIVFIAWKDNKVVSMILSFCSNLPVTKIERFCKKERKRIEVNCPAIVKVYNKHMGVWI